jgi:7-cyano-7-deazaguanine synthase in queuosine biosynthesis
MYSFTVRLGGGNYGNSGSSLFLTRPDGSEVQLGHSIEDFARLRRPIDPRAMDFVLFALAVYGCDRAASRDDTPDGWTRQFSLQMPVSEPDSWNAARPVAERMVSFLTGDEWQIEFVAQNKEIFGKKYRSATRGFRQRTKAGGAAVSLFSGGLDSLIGVIDWLESHPGETLTLSGAYDPAAEPAASDQQRLFAHLQSVYATRLHRLTSRMGIRVAGAESSYRSRSFCFVAFGLLATRFLDGKAELIIPENGSIALNYPLTPARSGSLSTRTVHPFFLQQMRELLAALSIKCNLTNPYEFKTKGEMIVECRNPDLLQRAYFDSVSCGNRKRYKAHVPGATADHCGYCVPCLYRQAAVYHAGWPAGDYGVRVENPGTWGKLNLNDPNQNFGATKDFVLQRDSDREVWRRIVANGRVSLTHKADYISLVQRQRIELESWFRHLGVVPAPP